MNRRLSHHLLTAAIGIVILLSPAYSATLQTYSDATVFDTMTQDMSTIDFEGQGTSTSNPSISSFNSNGFWLGPAGSLVEFIGIQSGVGNYFTSIACCANQRTWGTGAVLEGPGGTGQHVHVVLPGSGVSSIGMNLMTWVWDSLNTYHSGGSYTITLSTGDVIGPIATSYWATAMGVSPQAAGVQPSFWGITSDTPVTWIDIASSDGTVVVDNFDFGTANPITPPTDNGQAPEGATMVLIGTGLAALRLLGKFRAKPTPA